MVKKKEISKDLAAAGRVTLIGGLIMMFISIAMLYEEAAPGPTRLFIYGSMACFAITGLFFCMATYERESSAQA